MIKDIITYLNLKIESVGYFNTVHCLAEQVKKGDKLYPAIYNGNNEYQDIVLNDNYGSICYWRKSGNVSISEQENKTTSSGVEYLTTIPIKLVCFVKKENGTTNDQYFADNLCSVLIANITTNSSALKTAMKAKKVSVIAESYITDGRIVVADEFENVEYEPNYTHALFSIEFKISIITNNQCFADLCSDTPVIFTPSVNNNGYCTRIIIKTEAEWALDNTVYSERTLLVSSDAYYGTTDQRKFKLCDGVQTWSNLDYFPVDTALTLAEVLLSGNKTGGTAITSDNLSAELHIHNDEFYFNYSYVSGWASLLANDLEYTLNRSSGDFFNSLKFTDSYSILSYTDGAKTGSVIINPTQTAISHDDLIELTAPSVTINGYEIATQNFVDQRVQSNIKIVGDWDASSGSYPLADESNTTPFIAQWGATIKAGWAFRVGYGQAGTVDGFDYENGDVVYALVDNPTDDSADWGDLDHNLQQANESLRGTAKITTNAIIEDETTLDNEKIVTPYKFWAKAIPRFLNLAWTWAAQQTFAAKITFTTAPRFNSTTANQRLEVDANKDLVSVAKGTADNKDFGNASGTVAQGNDIRFKSDDVLIREALGSVIKATTVPIDRVTSNYTLVDTRFDVMALYIRESMTLTGVKWFQSTQGNYTADNYNGVGLYSYDGAGTLTLVASSTNDGNIWKGASGSIQSKAFSSTYNATPGVYFVAFMYNNSVQTTAPIIGAAGGVLNNNIPAVDFTNSAKFRGNRGSLSAFPATQSMTGGTGLVLINSMPYLAVY